MLTAEEMPGKIIDTLTLVEVALGKTKEFADMDRAMVCNAVGSELMKLMSPPFKLDPDDMRALKAFVHESRDVLADNQNDRVQFLVDFIEGTIGSSDGGIAFPDGVFVLASAKAYPIDKPFVERNLLSTAYDEIAALRDKLEVAQGLIAKALTAGLLDTEDTAGFFSKSQERRLKAQGAGE